jgi:tetratricopeptide (TPR) repeat protein
MEDQERYLKDMDAPNVLNAWTHGDLIAVHMLGMAHGEFSSSNQRDESFWKGFPAFQKADYTRQDGAVGYTWAAQYTLQFLDAYLKHDAMALAFLKKTPAENGAPSHVFSVNYRAAKGLPATLDAFRTELGRQGFNHATEIYAAMHKENTDFKLEEGAVDSWASQLISENHLPEAIELLKLNTQLYPDSANTYDSLGEAYRKSGQKELAIESYKKSLEKAPNNADAKQKLQELESSPAATKPQ